MRFLFFLALLVAAGVAYVFFTLRAFNHFDTVERSFAGKCEPVNGLPGPEDIQVDEKGERAFISSLDRSKSEARGSVHVFAINDPLDADGWRDRTGGVPEDFRPLGLYYYTDESYSRLFVVNDANSAVELFDVAENGDLTHLRTMTERRMTSPNDVVAVGPTSFFVSNDIQAGRSGSVGTFLFLTRAAAGSILYSDGSAWRVAAEGLHFANGVAVSPDQNTLYVAETLGGAVQIFDRPGGGRLQNVGAFRVGEASPDNINVDESGHLWVGAIPKILSMLSLRSGGDATAPSQIIRIDPVAGTMDPIYRDDGGEISGATSAARLGDKLLIGAVYGETFLICDLANNAD